MHATRITRLSLRVGYLDQLTATGTFLQFYDPDGARHGIPTYPYRWPPKACSPSGSSALRDCDPAGNQ
jgi:hypothetical protein